jgi:CheY-like chemotaxis protein
MPLLLILEDPSAEQEKAVDIGTRAGFTNFELSAYATRTQRYLEKALEGHVPLPDAMVIDIDLGIENGFELVRFWHSNERLKKIPLIIWSVMDRQRTICALFGIQHFIPKYESPELFQEALESILGRANSSESA